MDWNGAVDLMHATARRLVFETCGIDPKTAMNKETRLPKEDKLTVVGVGQGPRRAPRHLAAGQKDDACEVV
jgi:hypothetical protein